MHHATNPRQPRGPTQPGLSENHYAAWRTSDPNATVAVAYEGPSRSFIVAEPWQTMDLEFNPLFIQVLVKRTISLHNILFLQKCQE